MSNRSNDFIKALHTIKEFCLSINCEDCPLFVENGLSVCEFKPYLWVMIPSPSDMAIEALKTETKKCPKCGADMRVKDELNRVSKELNSEIEKSKSEIVPDYRDGWRLRGEAE